MSWHEGLATTQIPALGFLELSSIARGFFVTDSALKMAPVRMIASQPISSGKHVLLYFGDVSSVEEAHQRAKEDAQAYLIREVFIPSVHEELVPFLHSLWAPSGRSEVFGESVGLVESQTLAGAILSADRALKAAEVHLNRMRLGQGIGGKAYFVLSGQQENVEAALEAAGTCLKEIESLVRLDLIPRPSDEVMDFF